VFDLVALLIILVTCFSVAGLGGATTRPALEGWYRNLRKPSWNPPNWAFPVAWSLLFLLMAVAAWLVWRERGHPLAWWGLGLFALQLAGNALWSFLFFGKRSPGAALVEVVPFLGVIVATAFLFHAVTPLAGWLLAPYIAWVSFATVLNFEIWRLNRG
jgi:benzodiazapine receptor